VIDVGAAGKGYLVDLISAILTQAGIAQHVVDAGSDLRHVGEQPIRVGLEHPLDPRRVIGVANLHGRALCVSSPTRRAWGPGLHHILDARTGAPVRDVLATWVVADTTALADGLATALFCTEPDRLADRSRSSFVRMLAPAAEHKLVEARGKARLRMALEAYSYGHFPSIAGIILIGLGLEGVLAPHETKPLGFFYALPIFGGAALYLAGQLRFRNRLRSHLSRPRLIATVLLAAVAPLAARIPPLAALTVLIVVL
jgi:thiamine biosynthesis lipoprotein